ncbi:MULTISPECIES: TonB-dependent receptor [Alphaproteobacteria]|uniref:TonB-dependent receptor n=2 Tax=Pseudomonadota TaxID=1224 RepID=UPI0032632B77
MHTRQGIATIIANRMGRTGDDWSRVIASFVVAIAVGASPALAQESIAETAADENVRKLSIVTVTARKKSESELDVPESLTAFSADDIENANIEGLSDIGLLVPNLYLSTRLDGFPNVTIRGLGGFGNTQGVGFYLDDVQLFSDASSRFGDLERIEVLKGPQGILYGGSNIGGAVKFVSARPDPSEVSGRVKARGGELGLFDIEGEANIPLSDRFALRVFGFSVADDSYLTNPNSVRANGLSGNNDEDIRAFEETGARLAIGGDVTDNLSVLASVRYNEVDAPNNAWSLELDGQFEYPTTVNTSFNPRHNKETTAATLNVDYDMPGATLSYIGSYTETDSERQTDLDLNPEFVLDLFRPEKFEAITQELRLSSDGSGPFNWQVGAYYLDLTRDLDSVLNIRGGFCYLDPGVCTPPPGPDDAVIQAVVPFEISRRSREQKAIFANADYSVGQWEISAGVRIDDTTTSRLNVDTGISGENSETVVLGRGSLSWEAMDGNSLVYGTVSQGFEPADFGLANFAGDSTLLGYDREEATQYEIGYKGRLFDDTVLLTAAAFYIEYKDRQFELQAADPSGGFVEGIINLGDSTQSGFEADLTWLLADDWTFTGGLGYLDVEWDDGVVSPVTGLDLSGKQPPNATEWSGSAALDYNRQIGASSEIFGRVQARYKGESSTNSQFFDAPGDDFPEFANPSFTVVDLSAGYRRGKVTFGVCVENIFDEEYYIDVQEFPNFAGALVPGAPAQIIIGTLEQPRRIVGSVKVEF